MEDNAMDHFELVSEYQPTGDQPEAIDSLVKGFEAGKKQQTLLGVTGSGKTFTMANVIAKLNKPTNNTAEVPRIINLNLHFLVSFCSFFNFLKNRKCLIKLS